MAKGFLVIVRRHGHAEGTGTPCGAGEAWGSRPLGPNLGDVSLIFDINHKTESAVQSSWMNARVSAELLSVVGAGGGGEAHRTGDSGGLDAQK